MLSSDGGWSTEPSAAEGDPSQIPPAVTLASRTSSSDDLQVHIFLIKDILKRFSQQFNANFLTIFSVGHSHDIRK